LWLAVSESGISELVFFKVLHNFIQKHNHKKKKILLWSDLVSAHYPKDTLVRLEELKIEENPPNVPQIRPIEKFWANLKRKVYSDNYRPKDVECLMTKVRKELKSIETTGIRKAMKEVPAKAQKAHRLGVTFFLQVVCVYFGSQIMNKVREIPSQFFA
jgi:transposase